MWMEAAKLYVIMRIRFFVIDIRRELIIVTQYELDIKKRAFARLLEYCSKKSMLRTQNF